MSGKSRREFLRKAALMGAGLLAPSAGLGRLQAHTQVAEPSDDESIFHATMGLAARERLGDKPVGDVVAALGSSFLGIPYVAHSLEGPGPESLVVNLRAFDCTTFMENCLVLARCVKLKIRSFEEYKGQLQLVRYRGGVIDGYASRLHYFTDWVQDNERKGVVRDVSESVGGTRAEKGIDFMSTHPSSYRQLSDTANVQRIREVEKRLTARGNPVVPKDRVPAVLGKIRNGDLIGTATSMAGIDVSHTGIAFRKEGTIKFLHAPLSGGAVQVSEGSLADYLAAHNAMTGVIVARPLEPLG
jgi:cell wall-associated NlpC family hydrolase